MRQLFTFCNSAIASLFCNSALQWKPFSLSPLISVSRCNAIAQVVVEITICSGTSSRCHFECCFAILQFHSVVCSGSPSLFLRSFPFPVAMQLLCFLFHFDLVVKSVIAVQLLCFQGGGGQNCPATPLCSSRSHYFSILPSSTLQRQCKQQRPQFLVCYIPLCSGRALQSLYQRALDSTREGLPLISVSPPFATLLLCFQGSTAVAASHL